MFCNNCGAKLDDGSKFCNVCGNKIGEVAAPPQPKQPSKLVLLINKADLGTRNIFAIIASAVYLFGSLLPLGEYYVHETHDTQMLNFLQMAGNSINSVSSLMFIYFVPCIIAIILSAYGKHIGIIVCGAITTVLSLITLFSASGSFGIGRIVLFIGAAGILAAGIYAKIKLKRS